MTYETQAVIASFSYRKTATDWQREVGDSLGRSRWSDASAWRRGPIRRRPYNRGAIIRVKHENWSPGVTFLLPPVRLSTIVAALHRLLMVRFWRMHRWNNAAFFGGPTAPLHSQRLVEQGLSGVIHGNYPENRWRPMYTSARMAKAGCAVRESSGMET